MHFFYILSSLYKRYLSLKIENSDNFYLFESGIFYLFIDNDAKFMSNILNLKLTNLNSQIVKCGFPTSHLDKYLKILKDMNYSNIQIVSSNSFLAYSQKDYFTNIKAKNLIKKIANVRSDNLSISQAFDFIEEIPSEAKLIVHEIDS